MITGDIVKSKDGYLYRYALPCEENSYCLALKDGRLDYSIVLKDELTIPTELEIEQFNDAVNMAGLVYFELRYHSKPDTYDRAIINHAMSMNYNLWPEISELGNQCHGTYAKAVINRYCIDCYHREEAAAGLI